MFDSIVDISAASDDTAWAVGHDSETYTSKILKTANGGDDWLVQHIGFGYPVSITSLHAVEENVVWAAGPYFFSKSTDGGQTWEAVEYEYPFCYEISNACIYAIDDCTAWIVGGIDSAGEIGAIFNLQAVVPDQTMQHTVSLDLELSGSGFQPGSTVELRRGDTTISAYNVQVVSDMLITCTCGFFGVEPGAYDVAVTGPGGEETVLAEGFTVTPICGTGSGAAVLMLGLSLGLLSATFSLHGRRRHKKRGSASRNKAISS